MLYAYECVSNTVWSELRMVLLYGYYSISTMWEVG